MAPNRSFRDDPPSASSSSETEEEEVVPQEEREEEEPHEEEEVEDEEAEQEKSQPQSSDSETESEPDREPINAARNGNPPPKKRAFESNEEASKRLKTELASEAEKKKASQRLWSESDEMVVLKGLIEFNDLKKDKPYYDFNDFYEIVRKRFRSYVKKRQLSSKIQNFKKRFRSCEKRISEGGKLKPLDETFLEMSRKIWGSADNTAATEKETTASPVVESKEGCSVSGSHWFLKEIVGLSGGGTVGEETIRKGMDLVDERKRAEMDRRWRKLQEKELDIVLERSWLIQEQNALMVKAYKSVGSLWLMFLIRL